MHRQVKEGIGAPRLHRIVGCQRALEVGQVAVVLGVLEHPVDGDRLERRQRRTTAALVPGAAEEAPDVILAGIEHRRVRGAWVGVGTGR